MGQCAVILTTQRRDDRLAGYHEQLTFEPAILGKQKSGEINPLLEETRRDRPTLWNRVYKEAAAMPVAAHPQAVPDVIEETKTTPPSAELMAARGAKLASLAVDRLRAKGQTSPTGRPGE